MCFLELKIMKYYEQKKICSYLKVMGSNPSPLKMGQALVFQGRSGMVSLAMLGVLCNL
ncbi:hypothetical protein Sjap_023592 [Stephania japonica]|uniref:Uncharacterized protein n=1 Tax=Stephania japonica TaxID=461633 RepID=A0AAP0EBW4_9MAGN